MKTFPSYLISHIYLDKGLSMPEPDGKKQGNYLVFWWKDIALGQFFIEPGSRLPETEYYEALINAISPAIEFYSKVINNNSTYQWKHSLIHHRFEEWNTWMNTLLAKWATVEIPVKVPVSIIICTRNRASLLHQCLDMLSKLSCLPEEIIVVDNAPSDDSSETTVSQFRSVKYIKEPRGGLSIARNTGLMNAKYPIIAFTDDDAVVHPDWLYQVWETFEDPEVFAMTGLVISLQLETEAQVIFEKNWSFNRGFVDKTFDRNYFDATIKNGTPVWDIGAGVNMAFRKSVFDIIGYFDERLGAGASGCSEDSELWYRMLLKGLKIQYNPRAIMYHEHRRDMKGLKKQIYSYMKGHTSAALLQHDLYPQSGYKRRIFWNFPKNYFHKIIRGFPMYRYGFRTTWVEMTGILAGIAFYHKIKNIFQK